MKKLLILDEMKSFGSDYVTKLKGIKRVRREFQIESSTDIMRILGALTKRQRSFRDGEKVVGSRDDASCLDDAAIAIIDYDLITNNESKDIYFTSGEDVCYLARCFTTCGLIVGLNQFERNPFDLNLRGHPKSYADLNIGSAQINNEGLWGGATDGFRPWHWPNLLEYQETYGDRIADVKRNLDKPIARTLGMEKEIPFMPSQTLEFLSGDPSTVTFRQFALDSGNGLKAKDRYDVDKGLRTNDVLLARMAAARISKWIERMVFPGQDIIVDAPHVVARYPSLLKGKRGNIESWNRTTKLADVAKLGINHGLIKSYAFKKEFWLSRPAWFWRRLVNLQDIQEVRDPWIREPAQYVFCEDTSRFQKKTECRCFRAGLNSMYTTRYVSMGSKGVDYEPKTVWFVEEPTTVESDRDE